MHFTQSIRLLSFCLVLLVGVQGCAYTPKNYTPYHGLNPQNPQFERGVECPPLDLFGDLLSKIFQLVFWTRRYGNHRISIETEKEIEAFLNEYQLKDVKVRLNQWAPHKDVVRVFKNKKVAWPYRFLLFPFTFLTALIGRPFGGFLISDYYDPIANTINIYSDETVIGLHEAGHAYDFEMAESRGTYALFGIDLVQEKVASEEALHYLEKKEDYEKMFRGYKILYPAYSTYISSYVPLSPINLVGGLIIGHIAGRMALKKKRERLIELGKLPKEPQ